MKKLRLKEILLFCVLTLIFLSTFYMKNIRVPFTNSGLFAVYYSDLFSMIAWLILVVYFLKNYKTINKDFKRTFFLLILFGVYCLLILLFRYQNGNTDILNSLIVPRTIFMSVWVYLLFLSNYSKMNLIDWFIILVSFCLSMISLLLVLNSSRYSYVILQSNSIRIILQIIFYPLITYVTIKKANLLVRGVFHLATISLLFGGFVSGSRLYALLIPMVVLTSMYSLYISSIKNFREIFVVIVLVVVSVFGLSLENEKIEFGLRRNPITSPIFEIAFINQIYRANDAIPNNSENVPIPEIDQTDWLENQANASKIDSSAARIFVYEKYIEDIIKSPIFGSGLKQYQYTYQHIDSPSTIVIYPHNFILEYTASYGILGLSLFVVFTWYFLGARIVNEIRKTKNLKNPVIILSIFSIFYVVLIGLVQPIFLNTIVMMYMYFSLGYFMVEISNTTL